MRHQTISFVKSGLRIAGYLCLGMDMHIAIYLLVISEIVGIAEEIGHE